MHSHPHLLHSHSYSLHSHPSSQYSPHSVPRFPIRGFTDSLIAKSKYLKVFNRWKISQKLQKYSLQSVYIVTLRKSLNEFQKHSHSHFFTLNERCIILYIVYSWLIKDIMKENFYEALLANTEKTVPG